MKRRGSAKIFLLATMICVSGLRAQEVATIHVFTDRVQIPALVLGQHREDLSLIPKEQFRVLLDQREFPVTIRREGDDPLEVTILVDTSDTKNDLLPLLRGAFSSLSSADLKSGDHVSVYGMDGCKLWRTRTLGPVNVADIANAVDRAARFPSALHTPCDKRAGLWDVLWYLVSSMQSLPGRRILLPVTNGDDADSTKTIALVREVATQYGVSLFPIAQRGRLSGPLQGVDVRSMDGASVRYLSTLSELSGGIVSEAIPPNLPGTLARIFRMVRGRYILEFPRPEGLVGLHHTLNVFIRSGHAIVRAGGLEFPARQRQSDEVVSVDTLAPLTLPDTHSEETTTSTEAKPVAATRSSDTPSLNTVAPQQTVQTVPAIPRVTVIDPTDITRELQPSH